MDYNRFKSKTRIKVQLKSIKIELWSDFNPFKFDFDPPWIKIHVGTFPTVYYPLTYIPVNLEAPAQSYFALSVGRVLRIRPFPTTRNDVNAL